MVIHLVRGAHSLEFDLILSSVKPDISPAMFRRLMLGTVLCWRLHTAIALDPSMPAWISLSVTMAEWLFILFEVLLVVEVYWILSRWRNLHRMLC